ncbi:5'-3' exoribonuclease 2 [Tilletia horrida]|uniref:5'-3' exoribonuclease n=1 Tax=Tilletia horrida TaxID=155126 RepID=A0AAN6GXY9_9BASI|nr:5'-3' exoribonuclease 2 [Tilletia horrida]
MGVPALFRWLSKKYPKIIEGVVEEEPRTVPDANGAEKELPIDMSGPNPNGMEFDCLYLDMNGIVHPCTHPEGKPAPSTEEEMMVEVFKYTERVVNMVRPRKLLMMAIDGVAPRAKMNQQRSRRFRTAQENKEKQLAKEEALAEWKAMGLPVSDEAASNEPGWDSNAITPGTPFMHLLAQSLRYWVVKKMSEDPGWKNLKVIISDASVPGEGEHKIMEHIRRQRSHSSHDPNTKHVIYGLDADLIMLSLATHEPYFKVLREDVFQQDKKGCHICGQHGHIAANCRGEAREKRGEHDAGGKPGEEKKPFIFLDVSTLREYLEIELNVPNCPFGFNLERAIDDWVFLIFFVGNDFLPHLPSLEIRDGAIDTLLRLWKQRLPSMSDYLTKHGVVNLDSAQVILEGLAAEEDAIFRRRREAEERQDANAKRRKADEEARKRPRHSNGDDGFKHGDLKYVEGRPPTIGAVKDDPNRSTAMKAIGSGSVHEIIKNQAAIRKANLSAAETLKAELASGMGPITLKRKEHKKIPVPGKAVEAIPDVKEPAKEEAAPEAVANAVSSDEKTDAPVEEEVQPFKMDEDLVQEAEEGSKGRKRTLDEANADGDDASGDDDEDDNDQDDAEDDAEDDQEKKDPIVSTLVKRKVNADGTVEVEDTVKLWEPGYRERYYQQKFGVELSDVDFRRKVAKAYVEGLSWVLAYYYQGVPSWQWYYPYHYSPFAADFTDITSFDIKFDLGQPFRPFEQLMGVLPAASRASIPETFHSLMTSDESKIIDFYPEEFSIDMNGKKMAWQGVALLPFIDEKRLLDALEEFYPNLSHEEVQRNAFGVDTLYVGEDCPLYEQICSLYSRKKDDQVDAVPIDPKLSGGITGDVSIDPGFIPGTTFESPVSSQPGQEDIMDNRSIAATYKFPAQLTPHRSVLLKGVKMPPRRLNESDREWTRRGGPDGGRRGAGPRGSNGHQGSRYEPGSYGSYGRGDDSRGYGGQQGGSRYNGSSSYGSYNQPQQGYGGYGRNDAYAGYGGQYGAQGSYGGRGGGGGGGGGRDGGYNGYGGGAGHAHGRGGGGGGQGGYGGYGGGYGNQPDLRYGGGGRGYGGPPTQDPYAGYGGGYQAAGAGAYGQQGGPPGGYGGYAGYGNYGGGAPGGPAGFSGGHHQQQPPSGYHQGGGGGGGGAGGYGGYGAYNNNNPRGGYGGGGGGRRY